MVLFFVKYKVFKLFSVYALLWGGYLINVFDDNYNDDDDGGDDGDNDDEEKVDFSLIFIVDIKLVFLFFSFLLSVWRVGVIGYLVGGKRGGYVF